MKLREEFHIAEQPESLWKFFEEPEAVARCLPGVESVTVLDADNVMVKATQSIGPLNATFDAKVTVFERVPNELIRFRAIGRTVRGAAGNMRAENSVRLEANGDGTTVVLDGDLVLAGALGSVGQKVVAKQAAKMTGQFAGNLQRAMAGEVTPLPEQQAAGRRAHAAGAAVTSYAERPSQADPWPKVAAALSAVSVVLSVIAVVRSSRGER